MSIDRGPDVDSILETSCEYLAGCGRTDITQSEQNPGEMVKK